MDLYVYIFKIQSYLIGFSEIHTFLCNFFFHHQTFIIVVAQDFSFIGDCPEFYSVFFFFNYMKSFFSVKELYFVNF